MGRPLIITGMHRSGTSFAAELLQACGLHIGERLFPGDAGNPRGYFEDEDFLQVQRTMLIESCTPGEVGWPDWGWTEGEHLDSAVFERHLPALCALAATRAHLPLWGWKDPRTTLLLDPWLRVVPDARFLFVVREPWKVAASVRRLPSPLFQQRADVAPRIWAFYNRHLLAFKPAHAAQCAVVTMPQLVADPAQALGRALEHLGVPVPVDAERLRAITAARLQDAAPVQPDEEQHFRAEYPAVVALWEELRALA